jgi:hypothetical protein
MDSTTQTARRYLEIINELLSRVTFGFDSPNNPRDSEIINEVLARGLRNQQRTAGTGTQK